MAIVKTIQSGNATIYIHDDYCKDKTKEEIQATLDRIAAIALPALRAAHYKKEQETKR